MLATLQKTITLSLLAAALQTFQIRRPQGAVAEKTVDKNHAALAFDDGGGDELVGYGMRAKGLAPAEHLRRGFAFAPPGGEQFFPRRLGRRVRGVDEAQRYELNSKKYRVSKGYRQKTP